MISASRAAVPGDPAEAGFVVRGADIVGAGAERRLVVDVGSPAERLSHPDLFVEGYGDGLPPAPAVVLGQDGRTAVLTVPLPAGGGDGPAAVGPLRLTMVDGARATSFPGPAVLPLPVRQAGPPGGGDRAGVGFIAALLSAVLGGLVLNLMPCVLPVLSLKLAGVAGQAGADRGALRVGFAATALGIVMSFLLLAAALIGLKASGRAIGWGIQFQQPAFLAFMALVTTAFRGQPLRLAARRRAGPRRGLRAGRATVRLAEGVPHGRLGDAARPPPVRPRSSARRRASPCPAAPTDILAVFVCLGLGMALPYVAAALLPGVAGWLPRPGRWMGTLRRILGGLLLGTTVWLLAVLSAVVGPGAAASVAVALAALLAFLGWSARALPFGAQGRPRAVAFGLTVAAAAVAVLPARGADGAAEERRGASAFDPDAVAAVVARGGTVLVDVSAAWCLTCKVKRSCGAGQRGGTRAPRAPGHGDDAGRLDAARCRHLAIPRLVRPFRDPARRGLRAGPSRRRGLAGTADARHCAGGPGPRCGEAVTLVASTNRDGRTGKDCVSRHQSGPAVAGRIASGWAMASANTIPEATDAAWAGLMAAAQAGDRGSYSRLLRECTPMIRRVVRRGLNDDGVEDAVQEVLLTIHRARHTYDPSRSFTAWVVTISQRRAIDLVRKRGPAERARGPCAVRL